MSNSAPWLLLGGVVGLGLLAAGSTDSGRQALSHAADEGLELLRRIVDRTSKHEGTYDSLNLNTDQAGLSFGRLQWSQRTGALGNLLGELYLASPQLFVTTFGPDWRPLLDVTRKGSLEPVGGAVLWTSPWIQRFKQAGQVQVFRDVQDRLALGGDYMKAAIEAARTLGVVTERALSITYDTSVQQGAGAARKIASTVRAQLQGQTLTQRAILERFIQVAAAPFRSIQNPGQHSRHPRLEWRVVGTEWHVFAGSTDLYLNIIRRRTGLLNAPGLSDSTASV